MNFQWMDSNDPEALISVQHQILCIWSWVDLLVLWKEILTSESDFPLCTVYLIRPNI